MAKHGHKKKRFHSALIEKFSMACNLEVSFAGFNGSTQPLEIDFTFLPA